MKLLEKLAQLANELDAKGCAEEASAIDEILKEVVKLATEPVSSYAPQEGTTIEVKKDNPKMRRHVQNLRTLRQELGLDPNPQGPLFDRQVALLLNRYYPGVWKPRSGQKSSDLLSGVMSMKAKTMDFAGQPGAFGPEGIDIGDDRSGVAVRGPKMTTPGIPQVDLGPKPDAQLPPQEVPKDVPAKSLKDLEPEPVVYK